MLIVGNWKLYVEDVRTARALAKAAAKFVTKECSVVIAPPAPLIAYVREYASKKVHVGAQDISDSEAAASTGEVSARVAFGVGARYAIIGHSERRARGETNESVSQKVAIAVSAGLTPIVCVGERERDEEAQYLHDLTAQLDSAFSNLSVEVRNHVVVAYEPVWAIGKTADEAMSTDYLSEMVRYIRKRLERYMDATATEQSRILYGGSVDATNAKSLLTQTGINGLLVGRASSDVKSFTALMKATK